MKAKNPLSLAEERYGSEPSGRPVSQTVAASAAQQPYPGLRSFTRREADIFFGREEQTDELLRRLDRHRLIAVLGPSGCGKSSLVRAGLQAALDAGYMASAGARWRTAWMRPGIAPLSQLAAAICTEALPSEIADDSIGRGMIEATLRRGPRGLVEVWRESEVPRGTNLLVIADQFEEVFRYPGSVERDEATAFVALLLATAAQREVPVFVVLTMRSDFLGQCAVFGGLPEALNECQYLCPRLTREQRQSAIVGPARVHGGDIEATLVNHILNAMGPESESLPVLQHLLMRMWTRQHPEPANLEELAAGIDGGTLTLHDYEAVGGLEDALSCHADEAYASLSTDQQGVAERVFRRLCERGTGHGDVRSPASVSELAASAGVSPSDVCTVVEVFRDPRFSFVTPAPPAPLAEDCVVDISHESLIHGWNRLSHWMQYEGRSADEYRYLAESAKRWHSGGAALWRSPDLETGLVWRENERPTAGWASRYGGDFDLAMRFLDESALQAEREQQDHERQARDRTRTRRLAVGLGLALVLALIGGAGYWYLYVAEHVAHFVEIERRYGAPVGAGPLSPGEAGHRAVSLRLVSRGRLGEVVTMEAVDASGHLTPKNRVDSYLDVEERPATRKPCQWRYVYDSEGHVASERAYDKTGKLVWTLMYLPATERKRRVTLLGEDGYPMPARGERATSAELEYDDRGLVRRIHYRGQAGQKLTGKDGAFGQARTYDDQGRLTEILSLDALDQPMNDEAGNAYAVLTYDARGDLIQEDALDSHRKPTIVTKGWSSTQNVYDDFHRLVEQRFLGTDGKRIITAQGIHRVVNRYGDAGQLVEFSYWDEQGKPTLSDEQFHLAKLTYDDRGNVVREQYYDAGGEPTNGSWGSPVFRTHYDDAGNPTRYEFLDANGKPMLNNDGVASITREYDQRGLTTRESNYGLRGEPVEVAEGYSSRAMKYDARGRRILVSYFGVDGRPTALRDGYAAVRYKLDADGFEIQKQVEDGNGKLVVAKQGFTFRRAEYDPAGYERRVTYLDANGKPTTLENGAAGYRREFDGFGRETKREYLDASGKPVTIDQDYAGWRSKFDDWGREKERIYLDAAGKPVFAEDGSVGWRKRFDARGNVIELTYTGPHGRATTLANSGFSRVAVRYDGRNRMVSVAFLNPDGNLVNRCSRCKERQTFARIDYAYDARGNQSRVAYFGADGLPTVNDEGYHRRTQDYDDRGRVRRERYFDTKRKPALNTEGFSVVSFGYDAKGRITERRYYGASGEPILRNNGSHAERRSYDRFGNVVKIEWLGKNLNPVFVTGGYHTQRMKYVRGEEVERSFHDIQGALVRSASDGYAIKRSGRDTWGRVSVEEFLDEKGGAVSTPAGYAKRVLVNDSAGRVVEERTYDDRAQPVLRAEGYWAKRIRYQDGRVQEEAYFDAQDRPVTIREGYASARYEYDDAGNRISTAYLGPTGKPATDGVGVHRYEFRYDVRRQITEEAYEDTAGRPTTLGGCAKVVYEYDDQGNRLSYRAFGTDGRPVVSDSGYAVMKLKYDARGNVLEESYFDTTGAPMASADGVARLAKSFDARDNLIEFRAFGKDGRAVSCSRGAWLMPGRTQYKHDQRGLRVLEAYFEPDGSPATRLCVPKAQHRTEFAYDEQGRLTAQTHFGTDGRLTLGSIPAAMAQPSGDAVMRCARWERSFKPDGEEASFKCYDPKGQVLHERPVEK